MTPILQMRKRRPRLQHHLSRPKQAKQAGQRRVWVQTPYSPLRCPSLRRGGGALGLAVPTAAQTPTLGGAVAACSAGSPYLEQHRVFRRGIFILP